MNYNFEVPHYKVTLGFTPTFRSSNLIQLDLTIIETVGASVGHLYYTEFILARHRRITAGPLSGKCPVGGITPFGRDLGRCDICTRR